MDREDREHYQQQVAEHARLGTEHWCEDFGCESVKRFLDALDVSESDVRALAQAASTAVLNFKRAAASPENFLGDDEHESWSLLQKALARPGVRRLLEEQ